MGKLLSKIFKGRFLLGIITSINLFALLLSYGSPFIHPETIKILPLFGLAYPYIFLGTILLLVLWIFARSRWVWVILVVILVGGKIHFRVFSFGSDKELESRTTLNVMSYNVQLFGLYSTLQTKNQDLKKSIFSFLNKEQPEVVCFQEFYKKQKRNFITKDSVIAILGTKYSHEKYAKQFGRHQSFGIALFSKHPIIHKGEINFEKENDSFNYCIYADIVKNKDTFRVYNTHLQSIRFGKEDYALFDEENIVSTEKQEKFIGLLKKVRRSYPVRAKQAQLLMEHIKESPYSVIVCGDFNDTPMSYTYNQFNKQLNDAYRSTSFGIGATYAGRIPIGRIDYIFYSNQLKAKNFKIQEEALSDHYAISCEISAP